MRYAIFEIGVAVLLLASFIAQRRHDDLRDEAEFWRETAAEWRHQYCELRNILADQKEEE